MLKSCVCPQGALRSGSLCGYFLPHQRRETQILLTNRGTWSKFCIPEPQFPNNEVGLDESKAIGVLSR